MIFDIGYNEQALEKTGGVLCGWFGRLWSEAPEGCFCVFCFFCFLLFLLFLVFHISFLYFRAWHTMHCTYLCSNHAPFVSKGFDSSHRRAHHSVLHFGMVVSPVREGFIG